MTCPNFAFEKISEAKVVSEIFCVIQFIIGNRYGSPSVFSHRSALHLYLCQTKKEAGKSDFFFVFFREIISWRTAVHDGRL